MVAVTCELTWLIFLFDDLQVHIWDQLILYCDNQVALHIAANHVFHERTKYIELDQWCRERKDSGRTYHN